MKKFIMKDEVFSCEHCGKKVDKLEYSARDHCPFCLYSKHVDLFPGDRKNNCQGLLEPVGIEKFRHTFKIIYRCVKCKQLHKNIMAKDDNMDLVISLSKNNKY